MKRERNKRGKLIRAEYTQTIIEKPLLKNGKPNPRYPGTVKILHHVAPK